MGYPHKDLQDMDYIPAPEGASTPRTMYACEDGKVLCYGDTVPADAATGYAPGCVFIHVDGSGLVDVLYVNVGTKASANFDAVAGFAQQSHIADPAAMAAITTDLTGVDTGTDMTAAQAAQIEADLAAIKTAVDANNAAIDSINAALAATGITAAA